MIVMSFDPGGKNFGYCVTKINKEDRKFKVLESGMIKFPIRDLKGDWTQEIINYEKELRRLVRKHKPEFFIAERYILRGVVTGGTTTEGISMMLGIAGLILKKLKCKLITAAIWKNAVNRAHGKDSLKKNYYKQAKTVCTPHQLDAAMIGLYLMYDSKHYTGLSVERLLKQILKKNVCPLPPKKIRQKKVKKQMLKTTKK
jgi:Holliday junction resolvasome RuvABC endonuclease subunit